MNIAIEFYHESSEIEAVRKTNDMPGEYLGVHGPVFVGRTLNEAKERATAYVNDSIRLYQDFLSNLETVK